MLLVYVSLIDTALKLHGVIADMQKRGIQWIHVYGVDSATVLVADPVFVGYCIQRDAMCGAKCVEKARPTEAVGVVCMQGDRVAVVEYSELSEEIVSQRDEATGRLRLAEGNIANHMFSIDFLKECADKWTSGDVYDL